MKEPFWLSLDFIRGLHLMLLAEHGGLPGVRDEGLLESALARPKQIFSYADTLDLHLLAAAYAAGIIRNHPFADGNKRTGFAAAAVFLDCNGKELNAPEAEATIIVTALAAGEIEMEEFAGWLRKYA